MLPDYKSQFHSNNYDELLVLNDERKKEYNSLCLLFDSWHLDLNAIQRKIRYADLVENHKDYEDFSLEEEFITSKKTVLAEEYIRKYSHFQLNNKVQIVRNNRVMGRGTVVRADVLSSSTMIEFYYSPMHSPSSNIEKGFWDGIVNMNYPLHEFVYLIEVTLTPAPLYINISPLVVLPVPTKMLTYCPVCEVKGKPLRDAIFGGKTRIMCPDCYQIIVDMYGTRYTQNTLTFKELYHSKQYLHILKYSANQ